eukprot:gene10940-11094_t
MSPAATDLFMESDAEIILPVAQPAGAAAKLADKLGDLPVESLKALSFNYAGSILHHPQLSDEDKRAMLWLLAQSPAFQKLHTELPAELSADMQTNWVRCPGMMGIHVSRQDPEPPERVYKMRGIAEIPACAEVTYDIVTEFEQMQKWDTMLQSMEVVDRRPHQYPITRVGTFINTYGVPGAEKPRTVWAHMGVSGYVVSPHGEERRYLGRDRCQITMVLQVDPRGGVPLPVYNTCSMLMPMNLQRVKAAATKLKPAEREVIAKRQQEIVALSKAEAAKAAAEGAASESPGTAGIRQAQRWSPQEHSKLEQLVELHGLKAWRLVAEQLPGRSGKQCRERYLNHTQKAKKGGWSIQEELTLARMHAAWGKQWSQIACHLPGRSANCLKNHWNAIYSCKQPSSDRQSAGGRRQEKVKQSSVLDELIQQFEHPSPCSEDERPPEGSAGKLSKQQQDRGRALLQQFQQLSAKTQSTVAQLAVLAQQDPPPGEDVAVADATGSGRVSAVGFIPGQLQQHVRLAALPLVLSQAPGPSASRGVSSDFGGPGPSAAAAQDGVGGLAWRRGRQKALEQLLASKQSEEVMACPFGEGPASAVGQAAVLLRSKASCNAIKVEAAPVEAEVVSALPTFDGGGVVKKEPGSAGAAGAVVGGGDDDDGRASSHTLGAHLRGVSTPGGCSDRAAGSKRLASELIKGAMNPVVSAPKRVLMNPPAWRSNLVYSDGRSIGPGPCCDSLAEGDSSGDWLRV